MGIQHKEALRYLENAKEILQTVPIEENTYTDIKGVQEACGTAYLAVLKAIDEYLKAHGFSEKDLPQSVEAYREVLRKYLAVHNGRLRREFEKLYKGLHIAGYYRGLLEDVGAVGEYFKAARNFIEKI